MLWCLNIFFSFCRLAKGHWPEDYLEALEQDKSFDSFEVFECIENKREILPAIYHWLSKTISNKGNPLIIWQSLVPHV